MDESRKTREIETEKFAKACALFLDGLCIGDLRCYGRDLGVARPTAMKKEELTEAIIGILTGRLLPVEISVQGAPVKNDYVDERIPEKVERLKRSFMPSVLEYMEQRYKMERAQENKPVFFLHSPDEDIDDLRLEIPSTDWDISPYEIYRGQVVRLDANYYIYPLNGILERGAVHLEMELVRQHKLREGDIVSYRAFRNQSLGCSATEILTVNSSFTTPPLSRPNFDECISFCSSERIATYKAKRYDSTSLKFIDWLQPVCMGQRACVLAPPKSGKSSLLREVVQSVGALNEGIRTFALLVNQPIDAVYAYSTYIPKENVLYTTCEESADRHVFLAEFLLKRIKRMVESGENVFLVVDSLTELARAFNETEASLGGATLPCGLEERTVRYIQSYFDTAKYLVRGGSLTMLAAINAETGDPADDVICDALCKSANYRITLTNELVKQRVYPAVDYEKCTAEKMEKVRSKSEQALDELLRGEIRRKIGDAGILLALEKATSRREFVKIMEEAYYAKA